jgi:hypothetical protein
MVMDGSPWCICLPSKATFLVVYGNRYRGRNAAKATFLQPSQHSHVRPQNELVEARYCLTARELKMVLYACATVDPNADNFGNAKFGCVISQNLLA